MNSAGGSFGLSFGLAMAGGIMLWALALSFGHLTATSTVIPPAQQQQISAQLEHDAEVMSNTQLQHQIADEPQDVQNAVLAINTKARNRSLQVALARSRHCFPPRAGQLIPNAPSPRHHSLRRHRRRRLGVGRYSPVVPAYGAWKLISPLLVASSHASGREEILGRRTGCKHGIVLGSHPSQRPLHPID